MNKKFVIVIGVEDTNCLSVLLNILNSSVLSTSTIITTSRTLDLVRTVNDVNPNVVIMGFRNNQLAWNTIQSGIKNTDIPLVIVNSFSERNKLVPSSDRIVFHFYADNKNKVDFISHLNSVLNFTVKNSTTLTSTNRTPYKSSFPDDNLGRYVLELDQKLALLEKIKYRITDLCNQVDDGTRAELTSIVTAIRYAVDDNKLWEDFKIYFNRTNPEFIRKLEKKHPDLTPKDIKYCCYLKLNMSNDDIRNLLGINLESVRTHKYRLKRKLSLSPEEDLKLYLGKVG